MARIRTIKPEFWTDETMVELDYADRLLFIGLWNFADDQGFLPYRPKRIKMQVFPGDDYDVAAGLRTLWEASVLTLYTHPETPLIQITNWKRHQKISNPAREKYSPPDLHVCDSWDDFVQSPLETYPAEGKGKEGKGKDLSCASADAERVSDPTDDTLPDADDSTDEQQPDSTEDTRPTVDDDFTTWWAAYPRKKAKGQALKAYRAARKKTDAQTLLDALHAQRSQLTARGDEYCPYPATWLNGERWEDQTTTTAPEQPRLPLASQLEVAPSGMTDAESWDWMMRQRAARRQA